MSSVIILCALFTFGIAAVIPDEGQAEIINYENTNDGAGNYKFSFKTSNGITREESGHLVNIGEENEHMVVEGSYSYTDVDGKEVVIYYTADDTGYHIRQKPVPAVSQEVYSLPPSVVATLLG